MGSDWKEVSLGEIGRVVTGKTPKTKVIENFGHEIPFITPRDMDDQRIISETERYLSKVGSVSVKNSIIPANSISVSCIGSDMGKSAITKYLSVTNQQINSIVVSDEFYYKFVYYNLSSRKAEIRGLAGGSAQPILNKSDFSQIKMFVPPLTEQKAIAYILGSLDDKIELNRRMNETLEAMAQALFKSWFVDFDPVIDNALAAGNDIPDEFIERAEQRKGIEKKGNLGIQSLFPNEFELNEEMGWIPKGWEVSKLGEYIEVKRGGSPRPIHDYLVPKGLPWVKISDATASNSRFLVETKQFIKPEGLNKTTLLKKGSLILSNSATPGLPKFLDLDACIHDGWLHFPKKKIFTDNYLYQLFLVVRQELLMQGNGSVFTNLKTDILKNHMVVVPNIDVLNYFDNWINSFHNKIHAVQIDVDNLSRIRDTLLPKLMSGELRIPDAEVLVENV